MTRRERVAWAAGFFDGEGCITVQESSVVSGTGWRSLSLILRVSQKRREPLAVLEELFGGSIRQTSKGQFEWNLSAAKAAAALKEMHKHMVLKSSQTNVALEFQGLVNLQTGSTRLTEEDRQARLSCAARLKALKR